MRRQEALHLTSHHYRLHSAVRPVVDTSPPVSMYSSPKSRRLSPFHPASGSFYRPVGLRRPKSASALEPR